LFFVDVYDNLSKGTKAIAIYLLILKRNKKVLGIQKPDKKPLEEAVCSGKKHTPDRIGNCPAKTPPDNLTIISRERT
jgi:hypothetical protein